MPELSQWAKAQNPINAAVGEESPIEKTSMWLKAYTKAEQQEIEHQIRWAGEDNFFWQFIRNTPQIAMAIALSHTQALGFANKASTTIGAVPKGQSAASAYFGASSFANEWYETEDSDMSNATRLLNALAVGGAEYLFEQELGVGRLFRKYWSKAIPEKEVIKL